MDFDHRMKRAVLGTLVRRSIIQLRTDPQRALRQLTDLGENNFSGEGQQRFIRDVQQAIRRPDSQWYALCLRAAQAVHPDTLQRLCVNLGYTCCTHGVRLLRARQEELGHIVPAFLVYDLGTDNRLCEKTPALIAEAKELGVFTHVFLLGDSAVRLTAVLQQAAIHEECTFLLCLSPQLVTGDTAVQISGLANCVVALTQTEEMPTDKASALLRQNGCAFGFIAPAVAADGFDASQGRDLLRRMEEESAYYGVFMPAPGADENRATVSRFVAQMRGDAALGIFSVDWQRDIPYLTDIFSRGGDYLVFCRDGSLHNGRRTAHKPAFTTLQGAILDVMPPV